MVQFTPLQVYWLYQKAQRFEARARRETISDLRIAVAALLPTKDGDTSAITNYERALEDIGRAFPTQ